LQKIIDSHPISETMHDKNTSYKTLIIKKSDIIYRISPLLMTLGDPRGHFGHWKSLTDQYLRKHSIYHPPDYNNKMRVLLFMGQLFFYMAFACCVNVYMVSVHTSSTTLFLPCI